MGPVRNRILSRTTYCMTHKQPKLPKLAPSTAMARPDRLQSETAKPISWTANVDSASAASENRPYGITSGDFHQGPPGDTQTHRRLSSNPNGILAATMAKFAHPA